MQVKRANEYFTHIATPMFSSPGPPHPTRSITQLTLITTPFSTDSTGIQYRFIQASSRGKKNIPFPSLSLLERLPVKRA
jgi:hypothetical protein